jgi:Ca2+/Na+ antiporter
MKRYSTLHPLVMSFFSPKIYRDVAYAWRGACILYLLILVALTQIPNAVIFQRGTWEFVRKEAPPLVAQIPRMMFNNGTLTTEENRPYQIKDPKSGELLAVIDTTGATTALSATTAAALFTATQVSVKRNENETQIITYAKKFNFVVTRERITRILEWIGNYGAAVLYLCSVVMVLVYRMAQVLIFSLAGLFFAKVMHARLSFGAVYRITAAAMTPALIIGALRMALGAAMPYSLVLFLALVLGYLMFAVKSCAGEAPA